MFSSVLIANRGEIACRIARSARTLGMRVIAVYSDADRGAPHVRMADEAHRIGPPPVRESYLNGDAIIAAARSSGAQCIHPGYGFLSENPDFAEACAGADVAFVGPPPSAMRAMGLKDAAKALMEEAGVPVVPGFRGERQDAEFLVGQARAIGYPVMIKAVAGGGGKGMRRVDGAGEFADALAACRREALSAFGDERVLIEKFISEPRHIEIQVLADGHGNCVHLFERDCSLQRRHQKVIEEAPAPGLPIGLRDAMGRAAVAGATAVGYVGAGTVEFIVGRGGDFHFMEMNTRLQVEHPVTEMITGLDLVELQFRVAAGERLPFSQSDVAMSGHAIEARLYAESPETGFLPQTGTLHRLRWPDPSPHLRIDTGVEEGGAISPYYDPMIAKLVAWGETREAAAARLGNALCETTVLGLRTNRRFLNRILRHDGFADDQPTTGFIGDHLDELTRPPDMAMAFASAVLRWTRQGRQADGDPWSMADGWSLAGPPRRDRLDLDLNGEPAVAWIDYTADQVCIERAAEVLVGPLTAWNGAAPSDAAFDCQTRTLFTSFEGYQVTVSPRRWDIGDIGGGQAVTKSPMPGKVLRLLVRDGETVERGQPLLILEAMKMEHTLTAGIDGAVASLSAAEGLQVKEGDVLCVLTPSEGT